MTSDVQTLAGAIEQRFGATLRRIPSSVAELGYALDGSALVEVCTALRDEEPFRFESLIDVCGVDYLQYGIDEWKGASGTVTGFSRGVQRETTVFEQRRGPADHTIAIEESAGAPPQRARFASVYHLLSLSHNRRLRLRVPCEDDDAPIVPSVTGIWPAASWFEREAFDLFGILYDGHPDLRRLLTDYGFIGHPFRKDFPLSGKVEVRYDPERERVVYQPVTIEPRTLVPKVIRHDHRYEEAIHEEASFKELSRPGEERS